MEGSKEGQITKEEMMEYFKAYNRGDYEKAISYYAENAILEYPGDKFVGKENIEKRFGEIRSKGITEELWPRTWAVGTDIVAVEIDVKFTFLEDVPDWFASPIKKGEIIELVIAGFYELKDGKFIRVTLYEFPQKSGWWHDS